MPKPIPAPLKISSVRGVVGNFIHKNIMSAIAINVMATKTNNAMNRPSVAISTLDAWRVPCVKH